MPNSKQKEKEDADILLVEAQKKFPLSVAELRTLFESKDASAIKEAGGVKDIAKKLNSSIDKGLSKDEAEQGFVERSLVYGTNKFAAPKSKWFFLFIWEAFNEPIIWILFVFAILSIILGRFFPEKGHESTYWVEGVAVLFAIFIVAVVGGLNNWNQERQFQKLNERTKDKPAKYIRDGEIVNGFASQIQVGDLVVLDQGDMVPCDGIFISGHTLTLDESAMTGEPDALKKNEQKPFIISGTLVTDGSGIMLAIAVGLNSEWGILLASLQNKAPEEDKEDDKKKDEDKDGEVKEKDKKEKKEKESEKDGEMTPLQISLAQLAKLISIIGTGFAIGTVVVLVIRYAVEAAKQKPFDPATLTVLVPIIITGGALIVLAVPEGLPLAVTICLAYSMKAMSKDNNLVRHLQACETMGGATTICSDKTGTLTENRMNVSNCFVGGKMYATKNGRTLEDALKKSKGKKQILKLMGEAILVNSGQSTNLTFAGDGKVKYEGNKTECALFLFCHRLGFDIAEMRTSDNVLQLFPFSSERKRMSSIIQRPKGDDQFIFTKGASEIILAKCDSYLGEDGTIPLDTEAREEMQQHIEDMANDGLRTLCIGYKKLDFVWEKDLKDAPDDHLVLLAIVGIQDPLRAEVPDAIAKCKKAGIVVRMVTGDNKITARRIARDCGIYDEKEGHVILEGEVFRKMSNEELDPILPKLRVLARSSPTDKLKLVTRLKQLNEVVAVTGDGTNDGPALRAADIGLAMGSGTDIAKEACDIIITDDNFASCVKTVVWGRNVRQNIQNF